MNLILKADCSNSLNPEPELNWMLGLKTRLGRPDGAVLVINRWSLASIHLDLEDVAVITELLPLIESSHAAIRHRTRENKRPSPPPTGETDHTREPFSRRTSLIVPPSFIAAPGFWRAQAGAPVWICVL